MTLNTGSSIPLRVVATVFGNASSIHQPKPDLTLHTHVSVVSHTSCNLRHTLIVGVKFISRPTCDTDPLGIELQAS